MQVDFSNHEDIYLALLLQLLIWAFVSGRWFQKVKDLTEYVKNLADEIRHLPCKTGKLPCFPPGSGKGKDND